MATQTPQQTVTEVRDMIQKAVDLLNTIHSTVLGDYLAISNAKVNLNQADAWLQTYVGPGP